MLAWDHTRVGLGLGLVLIALGSGIIKPCVSANVGDQFGQRNKHLLPKMYSWFYFSIVTGACISNAGLVSAAGQVRSRASDSRARRALMAFATRCLSWDEGDTCTSRPPARALREVLGKRL